MLDLLFINWHVDPVLFHIGPLAIRWYSLLFVSGFVFGWFEFVKFFKREGVSKDLLDPLLFTLLIATIVGARLGHCLFYDPAYYFGSWAGFAEVFMPWKGGLASHGGAIALLLAMWWFVHKYGRKNGFDYIWLMDRLCIAVALAGCMIRCGNLFNSEIYGTETSLPWGMIYGLRGETVPRHPTQMYEAITYFVLWCVMMWLYDHRLERMYRGQFFGMFLVGCFGMRFLIEYTKETLVPWPDVTSLTMGQLLSIPFIIAGVVILILSFKYKKPAMADRIEPPTRSKKDPTHYAKSLR